MGTPVGCDTSNRGACMVLMDGVEREELHRARAAGGWATITTIEGLASNGELHPLQRAFHENHALQCGYCTPGMIMAAVDLLNENPIPPRRRSARVWKATCVAVPATTTSSKRRRPQRCSYRDLLVPEGASA